MSFRADRKLGLLLLGIVVGATLMSVAGTLLLINYPEVAGLFGASLSWLMKLPTFAYLVAVPAMVFLWSMRQQGISRALAWLAWGSTIGLAAELAGTTTGLPFGTYYYTDFLGPKVLGHVPFLVPLSWYAVSVLALVLSSAVTGSTSGRVLLTASFMVMWDLALDPAMVAGWPVWVWDDPAGFFYGMPPINLVGWWLTSAVIAAGYSVMGGVPKRFEPWAAQLWLVSAALPLGLALVRQLWPAAAIGLVAVVIPVTIARYLGRGSLEAVPASVVTN